MNQIIMVCNLETLDENKLSTSSSKYECEFAFLMSSEADRISIVSPKARRCEKQNNIELLPCENADLIKNPLPLSDFIGKIISPEDKVIIQFFGYNPKLISALKIIRKAYPNVRLSATVYDTHLGELNGKSLLKKALICLYYNYGLLLLRGVDYIILFKERAQSRLRLRKKALIIAPSVNASAIKQYSPTSSDSLTFLYSGTLCEYNCIRQLINAFKKLNRADTQLQLFGDGPLEQYVRAEADKNSRIQYFGRISNEELSSRVAAADIMINLRTVPSVVNDYAFPSKVVEYMKEGKAVLSTGVSDYEEFGQAVFLVEPFDENRLLAVMNQICDNKASIREKVESSRLYLEKYHNGAEIAHRAFDYLFS